VITPEWIASMRPKDDENEVVRITMQKSAWNELLDKLAAVSELLEALKGCLGTARKTRCEEIWLEKGGKLDELACYELAKIESIKTARAAIAKAEGRA